MSLKYVGDLSIADTSILVLTCANVKSVLEFGVGGSTMIILQTIKNRGFLKSYDTSDGWIKDTIKRIKHIDISLLSRFESYKYNKNTEITGTYDMIFVDGIDELRLEFALKTWNLLSTNGQMLFHDTRRDKDIQNVLDVVKQHYLSVSSVKLNYKNSNISIITKQKENKYKDWNIQENRKPWEVGYGNKSINYLKGEY